MTFLTTLTLMEKIRVFEAFAGYGSQSMALKRLGIGFEVVGISEIDKYAIQAYMAVHGETPNYGDISKIEWSSVPDFDFLTYSFPCTDISNAGKRKGLAEGSGTRSSLIWECRKAIESKRPKYLLMENVKNLVSKSFIPYLKEWLIFLYRQGYSNYTKVLNAKDFGAPQNRERVFMVSILGDASFYFPKPFTLKKRLKDVLEKDVDESFYLSTRLINTFIRRTVEAKNKGNGFAFIIRDGNDISAVIKCRSGSQIEDNYIKENKIKIKNATKKGYVEIPIGGVFDASYPESNTRRGRVQQNGHISPTLTSQGEPPCYFEGVTNEIINNYRIRKLTPRECFRLMGASEEDIDKIQSSGISNTQQYKMAGNSIVVDVLYHIFRKMFVDTKDENKQLSLF